MPDRRKKESELLYQHVSHSFAPVYNENSKILILGTFPSVKSREGNFYYHHPQNRFWKLIAALAKEEVPDTIPKKQALLLKNRIAVWDVVNSCDIAGSSDSSIKNVIPSEIEWILSQATIGKIIANGGKAYQLYQQYCYPKTNQEAVKCPSTSPANASFSLERLIEVWGKEIGDCFQNSIVLS